MAKIRIQIKRAMNTVIKQTRKTARGVQRARWLVSVASCVALLQTLPLEAENVCIGEHAALPGSFVNVPVMISNVTGLASASLVINFDPEILSVESVTNGSLGQTFTIESGISEGQIRVAAVRENALTNGSGTLVVLRFRVNAGAVPGLVSSITFADRGLSGQHGRDFAWSGAISHCNGSIRVVSATFDSNSNGLPDWWEDSFFGGPTSADPSGDPDGDGKTNLQEYLAGTDPLASEKLHIDVLGRCDGGIQFGFLSSTGKTYNIEASSNLTVWEIFAIMQGTGGLIQTNDCGSAITRTRYYRVFITP